MKKLILLITFVTFASCLDGNSNFDTTDYTAQNEADILAYINNNNLSFQKTDSGLYYSIKNSGNGEKPVFRDIVTVGYKGYFLNGTVFDESSSATFSVGGVVPGFGEAIQLLKPGGSGTFILPSRLGYGNFGSGDIKPGDVIVFDINLISIN